MLSGSSLHGFCPKTRERGWGCHRLLTVSGVGSGKDPLCSSRGPWKSLPIRVLVIRRMRTQSPPGRWGEAPAVLGATHTDTHAHKESQPPPPRPPIPQSLLGEAKKRPRRSGDTGKSPTQKFGHSHFGAIGAVPVSWGSAAQEHPVGSAPDQPHHSPGSSGHLLMAREDQGRLQHRDSPSRPVPVGAGAGPWRLVSIWQPEGCGQWETHRDKNPLC